MLLLRVSRAVRFKRGGCRTVVLCWLASAWRMALQSNNPSTSTLSTYIVHRTSISTSCVRHFCRTSILPQGRCRLHSSASVTAISSGCDSNHQSELRLVAALRAFPQPTMQSLLSSYTSDSDEEKEPPASSASSTLTHSSPPIISSIPTSSLVSINPSPNIFSSSTSLALSTRSHYHNPTIAQLYQPVLGPLPASNRSTASASGPLNHPLGYVDRTVESDRLFDEQYHSFIARGVTVDPSHATLADTRIVRDSRVRLTAPFATDSTDAAALKQKRRLASDAADVDGYLGPWTPREEKSVDTQPTEEQLRIRADLAAKKQRTAQRDENNNVVTAETSQLLAGEAVDWAGRSFVDAPPDAVHVDWTAPNVGGCYVPKRLVHTWSGHRKGVNAIRFFPWSAHLLLSACMDGSVRLWRVGGDYKCLRSYNGHAEAVRDISFSHDGRQFLSVSYDKYVKLWDTETGQCVSRHTTGKIPFCGRLHPLPAHAHECLVGQNDRLIVQWDLRANAVTTEYNEHLGTVNSVTFIDENRRFVSTSDDKKVFVWEYGLPVVVKHIADPSMHSIPSVTVHPSGRYFLGQSQDNQILIFTAVNRYKMKRDKRFTGHQAAGYACQVGVSGDGQWVASGDGEGRMWVWDWKTSRVMKRIKCHDGVMIGCVWNENSTSQVATCGWDGLIKLWD